MAERKGGRIDRFQRIIYGLVSLAGVAFIVLTALAFTGMPWRAYEWLATDSYKLDGEPDYIVVLGGGGVPSKSGLVRAYRGAEMARLYKKAPVIVALPEDSPAMTNAAQMMKAELILRGVPAKRIVMETKGRNTREQAVNVARMINADPRDAWVLIVTSPSHVKRALLTFRKAGFAYVAGLAATEESIEASVALSTPGGGAQSDQGMGGGSIGGNVVLRYSFWNNLAYEVDVARELTAMAYYRIRKWN
jgi:uncharacterized SAM-binding protein YcdF (DUF218 family)